MIDRIRAARRAHQILREESPNAANITSKAAVYREVKDLLDELGVLEQGQVEPEVGRAIRLLALDAEYYAGLSDTEGFRDSADAWTQYELLERTFG